MSEEIELYGSADNAIVAKRNNYEIAGVMGGTSQILKRDIDFGVIKGTKKPTLYKSGAEKIIKAYGLLTRFSYETVIEQPDVPFFYYNAKCELVKIHPGTGQEYVFATGFGSSNTNERRTGTQSAFDAANSAGKMACKRAMVMAALTIGGCSDAFEQDIDNDNFLSKSADIQTQVGDDAPITSKQVKRIFALAAQAGYSTEEAKNKLQAAGFESTKAVTQGKYDEVCALFSGEKSVAEVPKAKAKKGEKAE